MNERLIRITERVFLVAALLTVGGDVPIGYAQVDGWTSIPRLMRMLPSGVRIHANGITHRRIRFDRPTVELTADTLSLEGSSRLEFHALHARGPILSGCADVQSPRLSLEAIDQRRQGARIALQAPDGFTLSWHPDVQGGCAAASPARPPASLRFRGDPKTSLRIDLLPFRCEQKEAESGLEIRTRGSRIHARKWSLYDGGRLKLSGVEVDGRLPEGSSGLHCIRSTGERLLCTVEAPPTQRD